ncbi:hypothetical protein LLEC1_00442, partial [Akanthomyces lecanii]
MNILGLSKQPLPRFHALGFVTQPPVESRSSCEFSSSSRLRLIIAQTVPTQARVARHGVTHRFRGRVKIQDEERPVVIRARDTCQIKKIRCKPTTQGCSHYSKRGTRCHFTPVAMKKKRRRPAGFKYIAQLEERLREAEAKIEDRPQREQMGLNVSAHIEKTTQAASPSILALVTSLNGMDPWMLENEQSAIQLWSISVVRPQSTGLSTLRGHTTDYMWPLPAPALRSALSPALHPLPTNRSRGFPLFDEEDLLREFHLKYSTSNPTDSAWRECLNVVLSIAHRLRAIPMLENILALGHAQNALSVVSKLAVSDHDLSAVQALAGMACVFQGTSNPEPAAMLVAAAPRLAQAVSMHREYTSPRLTELQAEKRRQVFWKVYILNKDISLRTGRPFGQDNDDMDVRLTANGNLEEDNLELFNLRVGLALAQGQAYKQLYSLRAGRQTKT